MCILLLIISDNAEFFLFILFLMIFLTLER